MPEVTDIEATYQRKVQLSDFEPVSHTVTLYAELGSEEDPDDAYDELSDRAEAMVERAIAGRVTQKKLDAEDDTEED
jgi:hypothetical protein